MATGLGLLRLTPSAFWAMTPREMASAMGTLRGRPGEAPGRSRLAELMSAFPDSRGD